jgi:hypothetical protein
VVVLDTEAGAAGILAVHADRLDLGCALLVEAWWASGLAGSHLHENCGPRAVCPYASVELRALGVGLHEIRRCPSWEGCEAAGV